MEMMIKIRIGSTAHVVIGLRRVRIETTHIRLENGKMVKQYIVYKDNTYIKELCAWNTFGPPSRLAQLDVHRWER